MKKSSLITFVFVVILISLLLYVFNKKSGEELPAQGANISENTAAENSAPADTEENHSMSVDCKNWKLVRDDDDEFKNAEAFYTKQENNNLSFINPKQQTLITSEGDRLTYATTNEQFMFGVFGDEGFVYRKTKQGEIQSGVTGILQAMSVIANGFMTDWLLGIGEDGYPKLQLQLSQFQDDPVLSKYLFIICKQDTGCKSILRKRVNGEEYPTVTKDSPEYQSLQKFNMLNSQKLLSINQGCAQILSNDFTKKYEANIKQFTSQCGLKQPDTTTTIKNFRNACYIWQSQLLPEVEKLF